MPRQKRKTKDGGKKQATGVCEMSSLPSRKRSHPPDKSPSESSSSGSNVKVVVRIRPQNEKEVEGNFRVVVQAVDENILVFDPKENAGMEYGGIKRRRDIRKRQNRDLKFAFDRVFGADAQNKEIYAETTNSVLSGLLNGYNCSVFAYGATGAGKTYTMLGTKDKPGVMYHTMMDLYSRIESIKDTATCDVAVSYLEVYNETIRDLLLPGNPLPIREDPGKGVVIPGLSLHKPKSAEELLYMLQFGNQHRSQHPTDANAESSRSHAVFQVFVRQQDRTANISTEVRVAKMCLVDLAGSERATVTKNQGSRFREGANINRSLLALGNVINALAENKNKGFVPYRDSKLTRLLKDSLGGNCQTVMIAAVSPSAMSFEDTYNTLRYADRAKNIKATLKKNVLNVDFHMAKYGQIVTELRKEISELKNKLKSYEEGLNTPVTVQVGPDMSSFIGFQRELDNFFTHHLAMRSDQLQQEIAIKNLEWKLYRKTRCIARVKAINDTEAQSRLETMVKGMNQKSSCLSVSAEISRGKLEENLSEFYDISQRMTDLGGGDTVPEVLSLSLQAHRSRLELQDTKQYLSFTRQVIRCQERELQHNERLVVQLLKLLKNQHYIIKGHNIMTCDLEDEFKDIVKKVGGHELTWEDQVEDRCQQRSSTLSEMLDLPSLKLTLSSAENLRRKPSTEGNITNDTSNKKLFWSNQQQTDTKPLPYIQVDECSPPKAKRAMLTHPSVQQPVKNETGRHRQKHRNMIRSSSHSNGVRQGRFRSYSESSLKRSLMDGSTKGIKSINNPVKPQRVLQTNIDTDDISPECDVQVNAKFSKINDTITKAKKFSHLHTKSVNENKEQHNLTKKTNNDNLDGTFTIESDSHVPSMLPSVSITDLSLCDTCLKSESLKPSEKDSLNSKVQCLKCDLSRKQKTDDISNSQHVLNNTCDTDKLESGIQNDSNASTLVNQSGSSQTSIASTSTLVENLSQNLSNTDENDSVVENSHLFSQALEIRSLLKNELQKTQLVDKKYVSSENSEKNEISKQEIDLIDKHLRGSETVVKSKQSLDEGRVTDKETGSAEKLINGKNSKAARCIRFGDSNDRDSLDKGKTGSSRMNVRTPDRKPLQKVGDSNTPQTGSDSSSLGSVPSSIDSDISFDKSVNKQISGTRLFEKENYKLMSKLGLPVLSEGSLIVNNNNKTKSKKLQQSPTPGYMQSTKAHSHRIKQNKSFNSENDKTDIKPRRVKSSMMNQRPLLSSMRSKSMTNLSSRTGWQF